MNTPTPVPAKLIKTVRVCGKVLKCFGGIGVLLLGLNAMVAIGLQVFGQFGGLMADEWLALGGCAAGSGVVAVLGWWLVKRCDRIAGFLAGWYYPRLGPDRTNWEAVVNRLKSRGQMMNAARPAPTGGSQPEAWPLVRTFKEYSRHVRREAVSSRIWGGLNLVFALGALEQSPVNIVAVILAVQMLAKSFFLERLPRRQVFVWIGLDYLLLGLWNGYCSWLHPDLESLPATAFFMRLTVLQLGWAVEAWRLNRRYREFLEKITGNDELEEDVVRLAWTSEGGDPLEKWCVRVSQKLRPMKATDFELPLAVMVKQMLEGRIPIGRALFRGPRDATFTRFEDQEKLKGMWEAAGGG